MYYLERLLELAKAKGIEPEKIIADLQTVAAAFGYSIEEIAYSFIMAIEWEPKEKDHGV